MNWEKKNKKMVWMALALSASLLVTACGKKGGGGGSATTPVGPFGACGGCTFSQGVMMTANSSWGNVLNFTMRLIGDSAQMAAQATSSSGRYTGPVMIDGTLVVTTQQNVGQCVIPAGTYTLSTVQPGQTTSSFGDFTVPQFQAVGPVPLLLSFRYAFPGTTYFGGVGRVTAQLEVLQGPARTWAQTGTVVTPGATTSCNDYAGGFLLN